MRQATVLTFMLIGCGDVHCKTTDRDGTYLVEAKTVSGDCGDIPSDVTQMSGGETSAGAGCTTASDKWSEDQCSLQFDNVCTDPSTGDVGEIIGKTDQKDDSGDKITGIATLTLRAPNGNLLCSGTYDITYTRQ